jgi:hypothetical protein
MGPWPISPYTGFLTAQKQPEPLLLLLVSPFLSIALVLPFFSFALALPCLPFFTTFPHPLVLLGGIQHNSFSNKALTAISSLSRN